MKANIKVNKQSERNEAIDSIRGLACLLVLLTHLNSECAKKYNLSNIYFAFLGIGKFAVCIFFVLSAYFIYSRMNESPGKYFMRRFMRVYVPFSLVVILGWICGWIGNKESLIKALDLTYFKGHLWTVSVEIKFYFIFMLLVSITKKYKIPNKIFALLLIIASIMCIIIFPPTKWTINAQGIQWYFPIFSLGIIISMMQKSIAEISDRAKIILSIVCDIIFILITFFSLLRVPIIRQLVFNIQMDDSLVNKYLEMGLVSGILIFCVLNGQRITKIFEKSKVLSMIGRCSYTIYLVHYIIFWKISTFDLGIVSYISLALLFTFFISIIFYELIEKRFSSYIIDLVVKETI